MIDLPADVRQVLDQYRIVLRHPTMPLCMVNEDRTFAVRVDLRHGILYRVYMSDARRGRSIKATSAAGIAAALASYPDCLCPLWHPD